MNTSKKFLFGLSALLVIAAAGLTGFAPSTSAEKADKDVCDVYGKIKIVEYGEDYKVKKVDYSEDLKVKWVEYGEDREGKWKEVDYSEDFKIKWVDYGEDFKVKFVDYGEGC